MLYHMSFEFLLKRHANGGGIILVRSVAISLQIYAAALALKEFCTPDATLTFSWAALQSAIAETVPWLGAIFAGVYAALYSRFSAQWTYLADLYNQIMATAAQCGETDEAEDVLTLWKAGFVEDADELHLATKPMFASIIKEMLSEPEVRAAFIAHAPGHEARLKDLEARVEKSLANVHARYYPKSEAEPHDATRT